MCTGEIEVIGGDNLHLQLMIGNKARSAYDGYVKDYLDRTYKNLYERFKIVDNMQDLAELHQLNFALQLFEKTILIDIDNGKYAEKALKDSEEIQLEQT